MKRAVVVAVVPVHVVQVTVDEVVHVVAVGHRLVAAARTVDMVGLVAAALVVGRTGAGVGIGHFHSMLIHMVPVGMMEMTVVEVVDVPVVQDGRVAAVGAVLVFVILVLFAVHSWLHSSCGAGPPLGDGRQFYDTCTTVQV